MIQNHRVTLQSGVPDHREIRKIEAEIYGEPVSEYPGEWDIELTLQDHWKLHRRYSCSYDTVYEGCLWCEDSRRDAELSRAKTQADREAKERANRLPLMSRCTVVYPMIAAGVALVLIILMAVFS
jgi:hypothetical protein